MGFGPIQPKRASTRAAKPRLSVVIPVYNERETLPLMVAELLRKGPTADVEVIIVDDGSSDGTREWLSTLVGDEFDVRLPLALAEEGLVANHDDEGVVRERLVVHFMDRNSGKGAALRKGFSLATHEIIVIQDADLEYDPSDIGRMWPVITERGADVVYGSRFYGMPHRSLYLHHYIGNRLISRLVNLRCNSTLSDIEVCYKMFRRDVLDEMSLTCNDFGFEVEFTMKALRSRKRWTFYEIGISYYGRNYAEGKKINWRDGVKALWYILKFGILPVR
jgi:glycosyltransferase involved in cell wall biosynthesis